MDLIAAQARGNRTGRPSSRTSGAHLGTIFPYTEPTGHALASLGIGAGQHAIVYAHNALENS